MNFDPILIEEEDLNLEGSTIVMPTFRTGDISAPGATEVATMEFPFFDADDPSQQQDAFGWRYPVGTRGPASDRKWRECVLCNKDVPEDDYKIIEGKVYSISRGCLEQKLAQMREGGVILEYDPFFLDPFGLGV
jgi:hypothetical protein